MFVKGQKSANPTGQSSEVLKAIRHLRRLIAGGLSNITVEDVQKFYRDKNGEIVKTWFLEFLKLAMHYWPDGFVDPDAKPADKAITIRVEVVAPSGKPDARKADPGSLVTSTLQVRNG
jgi:hypothetical protein